MTENGGFQLHGSGPERYERFVAPVMAPLVDAVLGAAELSVGERVLDLACGTGFVARAARSVVGPSGRVVGIDLNAGMLAIARSRTDIEWLDGRAGHVELPDVSFDAVVCQQGLQFFDDLAGVGRDVARLLCPGGRFVGTVWAPFHHSPYLHAQGVAIQRLLGDQAFASFQAAGACNSERLVEAFTGAGLVSVHTQLVRATARFTNFEAFAVGHLSALPWGAQLIDLGSERLAKAGQIIVAEMQDALADDGSLTTVLVSTMVVARKPQ